MAKAKNILFIMFDQLRWDYLSCAGHPHLHTPHIDALAAEGVRFTRAYVQAPVCGASRMSFYTGRYVHSHGSTWNRVPLQVGEHTMGDHLRDAGMDCWLVGKTHMVADEEGMKRLGVPRDSIIGVRTEQCGFDVWERDDGMRPEGPAGLYDEHGAEKYNDWLRAKGYEGDNPWHDFANAGRDENGQVASGWYLKNARMPAHIAEEDSETPYMTTRAMEFMEQAGDTPWCCHLSYIKPHWPYIAPPPYNDMYGPDQVIPVNRSDAEWEDMHPVYRSYAENGVGRSFAQDHVRAEVIPSYMGLIKQCDDQMGRLFAWLKDTGRWDDTMIVLTSDHGDYLGDHWLGEKELFHDCSVKVPLIIRDPSTQADSTRGTVCDALVEAIDLAPTFLEVAGGEPRPHILEGRSILPFLHGNAPDEWREAVICESEYGIFPAAKEFSRNVKDPRQFMVRSDRWKFIHAEGFRPMLFDLQNDPDELTDLGTDPDYADIRAQHFDMLNVWARRLSQRTTMSPADIETERDRSTAKGILLGAWDENGGPPGVAEMYRPRPAPKGPHDG
ncbi:MAG: sulfatase-like hydrolase/transferase [Paracoccaceae bacterium]